MGAPRGQLDPSAEVRSSSQCHGPRFGEASVPVVSFDGLIAIDSRAAPSGGTRALGYADLPAVPSDLHSEATDMHEENGTHR